MKETLPNLYTVVSSEDPKTVAPSFLAVRPEGNIMFGNGAGASANFKKIEKLGPLLGVYIGDRHHGKTPSEAARHFKAPLCSSQEEARVIKRKSVTIDKIVDYERHKIYDDLEVIPTPGHTAGAVSYLWHSGKNKILFIGDTLVRVEGEWKIWVSKKNTPTMLETMDVLQKLNFNHIAVGSFAVTGDPVIKLTRKSKDEMIQSVISTLNSK